MQSVTETSSRTARGTNLVSRVYRGFARVIEERWLGGLHTGLVIKSLYFQRTVRQFLREGPKTVLDAGCGETGQLAKLLVRRYPQCQIEGWDLHLATDVPVPNGRDRPLANPSFVEADLASLQKTAAYDLIYSIDVLEHIENVQVVLDRLTAALRPGGMLFVHVPSMEQRFWFASTETEATNNFREHRSGDDHVRDGFTVMEMSMELKRRGLSILQAQYTFGSLTSFIKELFSLGEQRGIKGIGLVLLPCVVFAVWLEWLWRPRRGNGMYVCGLKVAEYDTSVTR